MCSPLYLMRYSIDGRSLTCYVKRPIKGYCAIECLAIPDILSKLAVRQNHH